MAKKELIVSGIMTGNSLDAVDIGTFHVTLNETSVESFKQIDFYSESCSTELRTKVLKIKEQLKQSRGYVLPQQQSDFNAVSKLYHDSVNNALRNARKKTISHHGCDIDLIGFHGQTLSHCPPSIVASNQKPYTIQLVDGAAIANEQDVVTIADFRSDDVLNGGEGAPFAPAFNALLTPALGVKTAAFINAGNTSNISLITCAPLNVRGWDCGPCNQFPDQLMREEKGVPVDEHGALALKGRAITELIRTLWNESVIKADGSNALNMTGPRSFDPVWYVLPQPLRETKHSFEDRIRTVVAFAAYCIAHSLAMAIKDGFAPETVLLFGGGWKNPVLRTELQDLLTGKAKYLLAEHVNLFSSVSSVFVQLENKIKLSDEVGLPSNGMEAGIFAFAAVQRLLNQPFTQPSLTNCKSPTHCGAVFLPSSGKISPRITFANLIDERKLYKEPQLSRAAPDNQ